ncbi:MAG: hypothetical protein M0P13_07585 [Fibrobacteraceae bacterium]|nr:hypothetical protein [Fibrobacteraceae bacterium]
MKQTRISKCRVSGILLAGSLLLAACGSDSSSGSQDTLEDYSSSSASTDILVGDKSLIVKHGPIGFVSGQFLIGENVLL